MKVNLKNRLELYLPSVIELIEGDMRWGSLSKIFVNRFNVLNARYKNNIREQIKISLYSVINGALNGEMQYIQFLDFIDNVFKDLNRSLSREEKILIKENISNLLEFEVGFLNYLGELSVLVNLMNTGVYRLDKTEYRQKQNGKGIDFRLYDKEKNKYVLVEVVNIELKEDKILNSELIYKFLTGKLNDKLKDTDKSGMFNYYLIPVIWGSKENNVDSILKVKEFYETTNFKIDRVETPRVYVPFRIKNETRFENRFGSILTVFNDLIVKTN